MEKVGCVQCGRTVEQPPTGRPRSYCSIGCRRTAEFEIRRLVRRIERQETNLESLRGVRDDGIPDGYGHSPQKRRELLVLGIKEAEARLRALLDTGEMATEETAQDVSRGAEVNG